jgi:hypothetical protein
LGVHGASLALNVFEGLQCRWMWAWRDVRLRTGFGRFGAGYCSECRLATAGETLAAMGFVVMSWALPSVRAEPVEARACAWISPHACVQGGCRDVRPAAHLLFLRRQEKKAKEGDPKSATPALRFGANLRRGGCGGVDRRAAEHPNSHTGRRCARPRQRCAQREALAPARWGRAQRWPEGMLAVRLPHPLCMRRGAQRPADQGSRLFERSEFERDPAGREHRRLPQCAALGTQTVGSPFLW